MTQKLKESNKYVSMKTVGRSIIPSFPDKKEQNLSKVSDKELSEGSFRWDSNVRQFVRVIK